MSNELHMTGRLSPVGFDARWDKVIGDFEVRRPAGKESNTGGRIDIGAQKKLAAQ